jgi:uncharacterized OB-fold protein
MELPKPEPTDLSRPFWDALREGHLVVQRCNCGHAFLPARRHCPACLKPDPAWERASGKGMLVSWVVYHTAYHPAFEARLPYNVALVQLAEGPRLLTNIVDPLDSLRGDAPVELKIEWEGDTALARFRLASSS